MPKIKWKSKDDIKQEHQAETAKKAQKERFKGKGAAKLTPKEKDELLLQMAEDLGYL